ncbi:MAG: ATP-binding protein, partial [Candidatus Saccharimonadales bacterium]
MSQHLDETLADAASKNLSAAEALETLLDRELEARHTRSIDRRFRLSRLQTKHTIDSFHFSHHKSRLQCKSRLLRLLDLGFLAKGTAVVMIGNPGVGKTFLAKIIGWRACQDNHRVLFTTAMDMLNQLLASQVDHSLIRKLKFYTEPTLLLIDELGYLSLDQQSSNLFYQVISTRHSHQMSTLITT